MFDDLTDAKRILREMKLLRHLGVHENIINVWCIGIMERNIDLFYSSRVWCFSTL